MITMLRIEDKSSIIKADNQTGRDGMSKKENMSRIGEVTSQL